MTSIVGDLAPDNRRAQWVGIVNGGAGVGYLIGSPLGGLLYDGFGYVAPSVISIAMAAGALLLALLRIPETRTPAARPGPRHTAWRIGWQALPARPALLLLLLTTLGVMFAYAFVLPQFMFYAYDDLGWTSAQVGLVMSAYGLAFMVGAFALGRLSDRVGRKPVLVLGLALFSAQFAGLLIFRDLTWIALGFIAAGLGNALYDPALSATILDITPPEHIASMLGVKGTASSLGSMLGPALVLLMTAPSAQVAFLIGAALVIMLTLACAFALRVPQRSKVPAQFSDAAVTQ
jgi:MFS family permease